MLRMKGTDFNGKMAEYAWSSLFYKGMFTWSRFFLLEIKSIHLNGLDFTSCMWVPGSSM